MHLNFNFNDLTILITLKQPKQHTVLSTFRLHAGSLHQDWLPVPVVSMWKLVPYVAQDQQHESRRGELPVEPRMGQVFTYWRRWGLRQEGHPASKWGRDDGGGSLISTDAVAPIWVVCVGYLPLHHKVHKKFIYSGTSSPGVVPENEP